jgi:hypothetical protein
MGDYRHKRPHQGLGFTIPALYTAKTRQSRQVYPQPAKKEPFLIEVSRSENKAPQKITIRSYTFNSVRKTGELTQKLKF